VKEFEEFKELQEFKNRSQEWRVWRGAAFRRVSRPDGICSMPGLAGSGMRNGRLPGTSQRLAALLAYRTETPRRSMALGNSREPPAFTFPSHNTL
jgi:hypothetical protein